MLDIRALRVCYGDRVAVRDFDLHLGASEIVTLVGPTGCGKSSVLRAVAGLERPAGGQIHIAGLRIDARHFVPPEKRNTGLVFQDFALFPHLTVLQNVGFRAGDRSQVDRWIAQLGLTEYRDAMPANLSGGQKQRVALARALAHQPALVLLDEPLSNLDAKLKSSLRWQLRDALKEAGVPALWVTHDQDEALSVGDRVAVMNAGHLEQVDDPEVCYRTPRTRFVAQFLGDGIFLRGRMEPGGVRTALGYTACEYARPAVADRHRRAGADRIHGAGADAPGDAPRKAADAVADTAAPGGADAADAAVAAAAADVDAAAGREVDVLVRPHDLTLTPAVAGNARVLWGRFEGETRLYRVRLGAGFDLDARVSHELRLDDGQRVDVHVSAGHPLPVFDAGGEHA